MADRFNNPLQTLRPGGYVNDISLGAMMRPALSMPAAAGQTPERTYLGGAYQSPLHSDRLPAGMSYGTDDYDAWRESLVYQRALQQGVGTQVLPGGGDAAMKSLNRLSWARGEGAGTPASHRGAPANQEMQDNQRFIESELWNKNLKERFGK